MAFAEEPVIGDIERLLLKKDLLPAGVDEVGRGCLAGPAVVCAVVLNYEVLWGLKDAERSLIRDSKTLSPQQKLKIETLIFTSGLLASWKLAYASVSDIEEKGIAPAIFSAMAEAAKSLTCEYDILLTDGNQKNPFYRGKQLEVVKGDATIYAIAAASIIAKQARDRFMEEQDSLFPGYGFRNHVGYGTKEHMASLKNLGVTPLHRRSFGPVRDLLLGA